MRSNVKLIFISVCFALVSIDHVDAATPDEPVFRAGAATSNITPPIGADPTVRTSRPPATHVHDELHARCLVLDDGQAKLALVVCDLRHISAEVVGQRQADHPADDRHPAGMRADLSDSHAHLDRGQAGRG